MTWTPPKMPKPAKPDQSFFGPWRFPLTVHPSGYYSKRIKKHTYYFGRWDQGAEEAERRYRERFQPIDRPPLPPSASEQHCFELYLQVLECGVPGMNQATPLGAYEWLIKKGYEDDLPSRYQWQRILDRAGKRFAPAGEWPPARPSDAPVDRPAGPRRRRRRRRVPADPPALPNQVTSSWSTACPAAPSSWSTICWVSSSDPPTAVPSDPAAGPGPLASLVVEPVEVAIVDPERSWNVEIGPSSA